MARNLQAKLEAEADKKGLTGERRKAYIGGAWQRIRGVHERSRFRDSEEQKHLSRYFGTVHEVREHKTRGSVIIRQGKEYYELPRGEYQRLIAAGREAYVHDSKTVRQIEREDAREKRKTDRELARIKHAQERARARNERRAIALYERELAAEKREAQREERKREKQKAAYEAAQERDIARFEREQDADVRAIIRQGGGIRPTYDQATRRMRDAGEYRALPASVKSKRGRLTMDDAAREINDQMPWLHIETPQDLQDYFAGRTERRYQKMRKAS